MPDDPSFVIHEINSSATPALECFLTTQAVKWQQYPILTPAQVIIIPLPFLSFRTLGLPLLPYVARINQNETPQPETEPLQVDLLNPSKITRLFAIETASTSTPSPDLPSLDKPTEKNSFIFTKYNPRIWQKEAEDGASERWDRALAQLKHTHTFRR